MATYWYRSLSENAVTAEGTIAAADRRDALQQLLGRGLHPIELREQKEAANGSTPARRWGRRPIRLAAFTRQLSTLSASGVPMAKGLSVLEEQMPDAAGKAILLSVRESVQGGTTFAEAMEKHPGVFPPVMTNMVRMGEQGGALDEVLNELSDLFEAEETLKSEVRAASAYPLLVLAGGVVSTVILVTFFVPRLQVLFEGAGQNLPLPTRLLLAVAGAVTNYGPGLALLLALALLAARAAFRNDRFRLRLDGGLLRLPWVGAFVSSLTVARFSRLMGTMTRAGVPIVEALDIVEPVLSNRMFRHAVRDMSERLRTGESLAALMKSKAIFPPLAVQMVAVGEESGHLDQMLLRVADAFERETMAATKVMTSMLAPVLILAVAAMVGFILISMMLPIFQLSTVIQ